MNHEIVGYLFATGLVIVLLWMAGGIIRTYVGIAKWFVKQRHFTLRAALAGMTACGITCALLRGLAFEFRGPGIPARAFELGMLALIVAVAAHLAVLSVMAVWLVVEEWTGRVRPTRRTTGDVDLSDILPEAEERRE